MVKKAIIWTIGILILISVVMALPPFPTEFYGNVSFYNGNATGSVIKAYYGPFGNGTLCGEFVVQNPGHYGLFSCNGDDTTTPNITEGAPENSTIYFEIGNQPSSQFGDNTTESGAFKEVTIVVPVIRCGDNFCSFIGEDCISCELDCGLCNATTGGTNTSTNTTTNGTGGGTTGGTGGTGGSGGSGGGGGGGGGGGTGDGGAAGGVPQYAPGDIFGAIIGDYATTYTCNENWQCSDWTECPPTEVQERNCSDVSNCGTFRSKPVEKRACIYGEEPPPEEPEIEEPAKPPFIDIPLEITFPKIECEQETNPLKNNGIWFFLLVLIAIALRVYFMEKELDKIKKRKDIKAIKKAKLTYAIKRRTYIFIGVLVFFAVVLYLFYVFFFLCKINFTALWILVGIMLAIPLLIHWVIDFLEYNEQDKIIRLEELADTHFQQVKNLIEIEEGNISDIEKEIGDNIEQLSLKYSFQEIISKFPKLKTIYDEMTKLYTDYQEKKLLLKEEVKLVDDIYDLAEKDDFIELTTKSAAAKLLYDKLLLLYRHFEEKQELYKELAKAEAELRKQLKNELNKDNKDNKDDE